MVVRLIFVFDSSPRVAELYRQWQALRISTSRFAELLGVNPWELADLLRARGLKVTNLPG
jgi:predicted HTH domain antitoxin